MCDRFTLCLIASFSNDTISDLFRNMARAFKFGRSLASSCSNAVQAEV